MIRRPPSSPLFPYPPLSRSRLPPSQDRVGHQLAHRRSVLEAVSRAAAHKPRVRGPGMPVDDEVLIGGVLVLTHAGQYENSDRKSTRLNSSHGYISYAVFCLK